MYTAFINVKQSAFSLLDVSYDLQHTAVLLVYSILRLVIEMETGDKKSIFKHLSREICVSDR
jgi:hypothetical protein